MYSGRIYSLYVDAFVVLARCAHLRERDFRKSWLCFRCYVKYIFYVIAHFAFHLRSPRREDPRIYFLYWTQEYLKLLAVIIFHSEAI
jgi:hypothetical protein